MISFIQSNCFVLHILMLFIYIACQLSCLMVLLLVHRTEPFCLEEETVEKIQTDQFDDLLDYWTDDVV